MIANRPVYRLLLAGSAAGLVGAAVCATVLLYASPRGVPRVAAGLLAGLLVVGVAAGKYIKRRAASRSLEGARLASSLQPPTTTSYLPPRQTSDDYWYPAAATRDRSGTRLRGPGGDRDIARLDASFASSDAARQARFQREMDRSHRPGGGPA